MRFLAFILLLSFPFVHSSIQQKLNNQLIDLCQLPSLENHANFIEELLGEGADVNVCNSSQEALLHHAAANGDLKIVKLLVKRGALINKKDDQNRTPLYRAVFNQKLEVVKFLLQSGACIDKTLKVAGNNSKDSTEKEQIKNVLRLTEDLLEILTKNDNKHDELLLSGIKERVEAGAVVNVTDTSGKTPLYYACAHHSKNIFTYLVEQGAYIDVETELGSPLYEWVKTFNSMKVKNHFEQTLLLFEELKKENKDFLYKKVQECLKEGAILKAVDSERMTPLHWAAQNGHLEAVRLLIGKFIEIKASIDVQDNNGATPLHYAAVRGHLQVVESLINHEASIDVQDNNGATPLHWAAGRGHLQVAESLINHGASIDVQDNNGATPLHCAAVRGHLQVAESLINHEASIDERDNDGMTPLHWAARNGYREIVELLINENASIDETDDEKDRNAKTPLYLAALHEHLEVVKFLLKSGACIDMNSSETDGKIAFDFVQSGEIKNVFGANTHVASTNK